MSLTPRQLALRRRGIGASEVAVLAGLSRWRTPIAIYEAKVLGTAQEESLRMRLGNLLEEPIARIYAEDTRRALSLVDTLKHPTRPYALATPDRAAFLTREAVSWPAEHPATLEEVRGAERLVQVKSVGWRMAGEWGPPGTDHVPDEVGLQCQWEMGVSGVHRCDVVALVEGESELRTYPLGYREGIFDACYAMAERFFREHVEPRVPPPPDASERYSEFLQRTYPREQDSADLVEAPDDVADVVVRWALMREAEKRVHTEKERLAQALKTAIASHAGVVSERFGKVTWKAVKDSTKLDAKAAYRDAAYVAALAIQALPEGDVRRELELQLRQVEGNNTLEVRGYRRLHAALKGEALFERLPPLELPAAQGEDDGD